MRDAFARALLKEARRDERIVFLVGDLGITVFDDFQNEFPDRFYNMGIAEANMVGAAAGLALSGKVAATYSIAPFMTARCLEQIRMDVCYHNLNVKLVAIGVGLSYSDQGASHHGTDDVAIMRAMPGMTIVCPSDPLEVEEATSAIFQHKGPTYLRLPRNREPVLDIPREGFALGKALIVKDGSDVALVASGIAVSMIIEAARVLESSGITARVINMHTIKPIDRETILQAAQDTKAILTVEDHSIVGGLGTAVAEILAESPNRRVPFKRLGLQDTFCYEVGNQEHQREYYKFSERHIVDAAKSLLETA